MKIALGFKILEGSWGGGNQFVNYLCQDAKKRGYQITTSLDDNDIDIILFTDPRYYNHGVSFGSLDILYYLLFKNKNAIVVHRINECDQRKNTNHMNLFLRWSNYLADHTVFISTWLSTLNLSQGNKPFSIILNGADNKIFKNKDNKIWKKNEPLKLVTHHWSPNKMKGFEMIDRLLSFKDWKDRIEFTYIGNLPKGFNFKNTKVIKPINGKNLGHELSKHHVYITASNNEPAGMHHIEGALSGLPIIYKNSGALHEYCDNYGVSFNNEEFIPALKEMITHYNFYKSNLKNYPNTSIKMTKDYLDLFSKLLKNREEIVLKRKIFNSPLIVIKNFIFLLIFTLKSLRKISQKLILK